MVVFAVDPIFSLSGAAFCSLGPAAPQGPSEMYALDLSKYAKPTNHTAHKNSEIEEAEHRGHARNSPNLFSSLFRPSPPPPMMMVG